jgi:polysaccharide deacetylase family protein (PEP-CTERM system associated)
LQRGTSQTAHSVDYAMKNILTFDIEGFIDALHESVTIPQRYTPDFSEQDVVQRNTMDILDVLSEHSCKGTFFMLGWIGSEMPSLVKTIAGEGHEIACHGFLHKRLFNFSPAETEESLKKAKYSLEDACGCQVHGFRAPDFSIIKTNLWVHDILRKLSFTYDSSIFPISFHDVYGIGTMPAAPFKLPNGLIELPPSTVRVIKNIPFGGGGYFRLYPFFITKILFTLLNKQGIPGMFYLHPYEFGACISRIEGMSLMRRFRTYYGVGRTKQKLARLLTCFEFCRAIDYIKNSWNE